MSVETALVILAYSNKFLSSNIVVINFFTNNAIKTATDMSKLSKNLNFNLFFKTDKVIL